MTKDYKATLFLPQTDFPMKAGLPQREPEFLARWYEMDLYRRLREQAKGREQFILHDGPPYANGNIHMGTAMNKVLKDVVVRTQQMLGKDSNYVPGWDCHGLPIEWKIEEQYRAAGKNKDDVPVVEFRQECRQFALHWLDVQREEFKRLGVIGDWDNPYMPIRPDSEKVIVGELLKFLMNGGLYRGAKPVMWSVVEKTALAEAEIEYHDHTSTTIHVRFPVVKGPAPFAGNSIVIWTTTPWTMPGNRAIAFGPELDYVGIEVAAVKEGALARVGETLFVAAALREAVEAEVGIMASKIVWEGPGSAFEGVVCHHPFHGHGYDFDVPLLPGEHVTVEQGTGFVHTAPGHGEEDYVVGMQFGLEVPETVDEGGLFMPHVPLFAGQHVFKANGPVADKLQEFGALLHRGKLVHSYPHSWRSKAPLIFRNTPQWFVSMETNDLRKTALAEIDRVKWYPPQGRNRIHSMIENRPDWVLSRQRSWGVPLTLFLGRESREPLRDPAVNERILEIIGAEGADAWFSSPPERFLGPDHDPADWEMLTDTVDVWFDSGTSHAYVLETREDLKTPASLYLEGSDQHRGWFHSSLLESCGTRGRAPYEAVLTHGFVLDGDGRKMSKSLGNTVLPQEVIGQFGADILRLWVVASDFTEDLRISPEILKSQVDSYRRLRNTLRFILGNLARFDERERLPAAEMPELERWVLSRLAALDAQVREACERFDFHQIFVSVYTFCTIELSSFYLDIRKDALYCDAADSVRRRAARTVLDTLFDSLTAWLAPILCFTAEEAWQTRGTGPEESVHLRLFPELPAEWRDPALDARWERIRRMRRVVTGALEIERREKRIGASLQAHPVVHLSAGDAAIARSVDFAELCITSGVSVSEAAAPDDAFRIEDVDDVAVVPGLAEGSKCQRCWMVLPDVGTIAGHDDLCGRCASAVEAADTVAA
ncbi:isoleucine--tRNA ligase [Oceanibacterium hippocampi]|nr:isoleucine--tRNA ligase [Oceanibacterium hippocampi]